MAACVGRSRECCGNEECWGVSREMSRAAGKVGRGVVQSAKDGERGGSVVAQVANAGRKAWREGGEGGGQASPTLLEYVGCKPNALDGVRFCVTGEGCYVRIDSPFHASSMAISKFPKTRKSPGR